MDLRATVRKFLKNHGRKEQMENVNKSLKVIIVRNLCRRTRTRDNVKTKQNTKI